MEAQEELSITKQSAMIKGKRTKRPRASPVISQHPNHHHVIPASSAENGVVSATSSSDNNNNNNNRAISSGSTTEEEEDMAHCLILLAQGRNHHHHHHHDHHHDHPPEQPMVIKHVRISSGDANDVVYQCKTCDRCFPSFQALGGHRASHKKLKPNNNNAATSSEATSFDHESLFATTTSTALSLQVSPSRGISGIKGNGSNGNNGTSNNVVKVSKVHECSVCGAEFTSGQALGGHMRRHRTTSFTNPNAAFCASTNSPDRSQESSKKSGSGLGLGSGSGSGSGSRNVLELDLNLPAPEERATKFPFPASAGGNEQVIVFSASPLVDCHY